MSAQHEELAATLRTHVAADERERVALAATLDRLEWPEDPFDERTHDHHLTSSGFVISSRGILLHKHRLLGRWLQPGGHVDPGETPEVACRREVVEETGLATRHLYPALLFHVDLHPGPRGHTHYDLRYVLIAEPLAPRPAPGESPEVAWFDFAAAVEFIDTDLAAVLSRLATRRDDLLVSD